MTTFVCTTTIEFTVEAEGEEDAWAEAVMRINAMEEHMDFSYTTPDVREEVA